MDLPELWLQHQVIAQPYDGTDGNGRPIYGPSAVVACWQEDKRRLVRSAQTGNEVISETTVYAQLEQAQHFTPEGRVTLTDGRVATVINVLRRDGRELPLPSHVEVILT